ncbi:CPBP family intramembrane glutamic endopeptidase [Bradyrhizobium yuanmingense]|uniref:Membrane protease YdiL (CAAX protease family) n=1 Tax=Bradyrhizobium yuanmingense TaxID=108015 RepID=A0ABV4GID8_9BRAD|nr:CPBP family intramembrane glutamic endopeptidase [Bradyrhizobium yuanmingense]
MEEHSFVVPKERESNRSDTRPLIWWFVLALIALVASQIMRLHQHQAASWLLWDYVGRITALTILAAVPSARIAAFRTGGRQISLFEIVLWIVGICLLDRFVQLPQSFLNAAFPTTVLGAYPHPTGWLKAFDLFLGLALVAISEEVIFRRYIRLAFRPYLGDGIFAVLTTSVLFGAVHWWAGLGNVLSTATVGLFLMLMLRRSGVLWPVALAHYLLDLINFA